MVLIGAFALIAIIAAAGALYQFVGTRRDARRYAARGVMIDVDAQRLHMVCGSG
jgi:hypothetical protein